MQKKMFLLAVTLLVCAQSIKAQHLQKKTSGNLEALWNASPKDWIESMAYAQRLSLEMQKSGAKDKVLFIGYTYKGEINTAEMLEHVKKELIADHTYTSAMKEKGLVTLGQLREMCDAQGIRYPFVLTARAHLDTVVQKGMVVIDMQYACQGKMVTVPCVAYREGRIVYDPVGSFLLGVFQLTKIERSSKSVKLQKQITLE